MVWAELMSQINIFPIASGVARVGNLVVVFEIHGCDFLPQAVTPA